MDNYQFLNGYMKVLIPIIEKQDTWNTNDLRQVLFNTHLAYIVNGGIDNG